MQTIVGNCAICGAPIYQYQGTWSGTLPPPVYRSCGCEITTGSATFSPSTETKTKTADCLFREVEYSPLQYGIMFCESGQTMETRWYDTEEERDNAVIQMLETGKLEIKSALSRFVRTVEPYAFSAVNAANTFYKRS